MSKQPVLRFKGYTKEWETRKVGDVTNVLSASRVHKNEWTSDGVPFFRSSDVVSSFKGNDNEKAFISFELYSELIKTSGKLQKGDILITGGGSIGIPYIVPNNDPLYSKDADLLWIKASQEHNSEYLFAYLTSPSFRKYISSISHIGTIAHYTIEQIKVTPVQLPEMAEQTNIGMCFRNLERLISFHQRKYDKLLTYKKVMLEKMFPKDGADVPEIRFSGFTTAWKQHQIGDFYDFKNGLNKGKEFFGTGTPIVNFTDVFHNRGIYASQLQGKVNLEPSETSNYEVRKGDIFFTRTSETIEEIGYPSVMLDEPQNTVFSGFVLRGRCIFPNDPLDNLFKKYVFFTKEFRKEMIKKSSMTTRALTSGTSLKSMVFQFPSSKEEQHKIGEYLSSIDSLINLQQQKISRLKQLKAALLERMFI